MKKLFLLSILFLVLDCSSNEMEGLEQQQESVTDPLNWCLALALRRPIQWKRIF